MGRQGWFVCHKVIIMPLHFQVTKQSKVIITLLHFQVTKQKEIFQNRDDQNPQAGESWREGGCPGVVHMLCPDYECTCKKANKADTCVKPISARRPRGRGRRGRPRPHLPRPHFTFEIPAK